MTEINLTPTIKNPWHSPRVKKGTDFGMRIDMTPMVDLGFLLITFFVLTTEMSKPAVTKLSMPKHGIITKIPESRSITVLLSGSDQIFYYFGTEETAMKNKMVYRTSFDVLTGLGKVIRQKQIDLEQDGIERGQLIVLIKPGQESSYKNLVAALDEMLINNVARYVVTDLEMDEVAFVRLHK